jgi:integrase/recombinase XerD
MEDIQRPDVEVYARHSRKCIYRGTAKRPEDGRCRCRKWLYVRGTRERITADTRSWGTARTKAREYADQHDPAKIAERTAQLNFTPKLLTDAFDKFFTAKRAGGTGEKSIANLTTPRNQLLEYVSQQNARQVDKIVYVHEITPEFLTDWMGTWKDRTHYSKGKKRKNINAFFRHCLAQHWIKRNPAEGMPKISKRNQPSAIPKIPFTRPQMVAILHAAANYHRNLNGHSADLEGKADRLHAFVGVMRSAGLSILDTTILERTRLAADDRLELYRHKTGEPVYLPLEPELANELRGLAAIPEGDPRYFFWSGHGGPEHAANLWGKALRRLWPMVKPALDLQDRYGFPLRPSSHFFRDTFAKEMVETGKVSIDQLATLLGDNPATVREHYFKWVPDLQVALDAAVRASWKMRKQDIEQAHSCPTCGRPLENAKKPPTVERAAHR